MVSALLFALAAWAKRVLSEGSWYSAITWSGIVVAVGATVTTTTLLAFFLGFSGDDRQRLLRRIQMAMSPVSK